MYCHTAAKLVFIRFFRHTRHVYSHTVLGWSVWTVLCFLAVAVAFVLAAAVPIFSDLIGITAALFAAWYTYGLAGFFWLYDTFHLEGGTETLKRKWIGTTVAVLTIMIGAFICIAGTYVSVKVRGHFPCDGYHEAHWSCSLSWMPIKLILWASHSRARFRFGTPLRLGTLSSLTL